MADQTRKLSSPATSRANPAITATAARPDGQTRSGPSAADARRRRGCVPNLSSQASECQRCRLHRIRASIDGANRKMIAMRASPAGRSMRGPFLVPARVLLLAAGLLSIALGGFNLAHDTRSTNVDIIYVAVGGLVGLIWMGSLYLAWRGFRLAVFAAGLIAFTEFGVIASGHFVSAPWEIDIYAKHEGLEVAGVLIALLPACALTVMAAIVSWSHPTGRRRQLEMLPLILVSLLGAVLAVLQTTDNVARKDFGTATPEDGAFAAAIAVILWLVGAFWLARARRTGALLIML